MVDICESIVGNACLYPQGSWLGGNSFNYKCINMVPRIRNKPISFTLHGYREKLMHGGK